MGYHARKFPVGHPQYRSAKPKDKLPPKVRDLPKIPEVGTILTDKKGDLFRVGEITPDGIYCLESENDFGDALPLKDLLRDYTIIDHFPR